MALSWEKVRFSFWVLRKSSAARAAHRGARPLLHLLQRAYVCQAMAARLWRTTEYRGALWRQYKNRAGPTRLTIMSHQT